MDSETGPDEQTSSGWASVDDSGTNTPKDLQEIDFVTLGMFIIDEIEYPLPRPPQKDILGGAGSYSALGARLFSPAPLASKTVGWIVDQGSDFPPAITTLIDSWGTSALMRHDPSRLTTRGWNGYVDEQGTRAFKYTTPKKRLTAADLSGTPLLQSKSFHMVCSADRCRELVGDIIALRKDEAPPEDAEGGGGYTRPIIIWEPVPDLCTPDELLKLTNCLPLVDVCSPNHSELAAFMGDSGVDPETGEISTAAVERACEQLLGSMPLSSFTLVIRAGEKGCYIARNGGRRKPNASASGGKAKGGERRRKALGHRGALQPDTDMMSLFAGLLQQSDQDAEQDEPTFSFIREEDNEVEMDPGLDRWMPAYWTKEHGDKVVDPTGGGNTFLGGLAAAMARGKSMEEAASWGSVAASFAIEQVGMPTLGSNGDGRETWNGVTVDSRLDEFHERIGWSPD
ncbi:hypothetical protein N0V82_003037 [Gnomoniopsis sp. IMI 355080]|nr:hypothetical protein N0V82_003037 [Gnomoniopsis sp. IMI 355080]